MNISSGTGSLDRATGPDVPHVGSFAAYRSSKTALNMLTVTYAYALGDAFKVNALAPGLRRTDLNARASASDGGPAEAAAGAVRLALLPDDGPTARFLSWTAPQSPGDPGPGAAPLAPAAWRAGDRGLELRVGAGSGIGEPAAEQR